MSASELGEWLAEYSISPWGEWREDWRMAQYVALYAEVHRNSKIRKDPYVPNEFMFDFVRDMQDKVKRDLELSKRLKSALLGFRKREKP